MSGCTLCPRKCGTDRSVSVGFCGADDGIKIARAALHFWEEPFISGKGGSGTVFFSHCNLKCVFCQNYQISAEGFGKRVSADRFFEILADLAEQGAENINLVSPTHYAAAVAPILQKFKARYNLPVVYNCGGYEEVETLKMLEGIVDVYLPDIKYFDSRVSAKYSCADDYFQKASKAVAEMRRQRQKDIFEGGMMKSGVAVRHLILPTLADQSIKILDWVRQNLGADTFVSLMAQYSPFYLAHNYPEIDRKITAREYERVLYAAEEMGFKNLLAQELCSADEKFVPSFDLQGV